MINAELLKQLNRCTMLYPEQRLCQIIVNATGRSDPFYVTDKELACCLSEYADRRGYIAR